VWSGAVTDPVKSALVHESVLPLPEYENGPDVAVNAVSPEFSQVIAPAVEEIAPNSDNSAVVRMMMRVIVIVLDSDADAQAITGDHTTPTRARQSQVRRFCQPAVRRP
jgi:hypothetical protein